MNSYLNNSLTIRSSFEENIQKLISSPEYRQARCDEHYGLLCKQNKKKHTNNSILLKKEDFICPLSVISSNRLHQDLKNDKSNISKIMLA